MVYSFNDKMYCFGGRSYNEKKDITVINWSECYVFDLLQYLCCKEIGKIQCSVIKIGGDSFQRSFTSCMILNSLTNFSAVAKKKIDEKWSVETVNSHKTFLYGGSENESRLEGSNEFFEFEIKETGLHEQQISKDFTITVDITKWLIFPKRSNQTKAKALFRQHCLGHIHFLSDGMLLLFLEVI